MLAEIKLFLSLLVILSITNAISAGSGPYVLPTPKDCHRLENSVVHVTGLCELRKCHIDDDYVTCHIFRAVTMCDCKKGYLFDECTGKCVRPRHCPKVIGGRVDCNHKPLKPFSFDD